MEDLAFSRSFRHWVLNRDSVEKGFWDNWIAGNPDKAEMVKYAKAVIYALHLQAAMLSEDEIDEEVRKALFRLREAPRYIPLDGPEGRAGRWMGLMRFQRVWAAIALVVAMVLGGYFLYRTHFHQVVLQAFLNSHRKETIHQQVADGIEDQTFNLPDGSLVRLGKTGQLYYPTDWPVVPNPREVFLQGEAYFDIRKNPAAPFYVYTDRLIIRVLGTSFVVHSLPSDTRTTVTVVTGKVSVYRQEDFFSPLADNGRPVGMILTPNQQGVYDRGEDRLHKTLIRMPEPLGDKPDSSLVFHGTPVRQVFGRLQELYGVPIQYDEEMVDRCVVTATLGSESFYDKLNIICKAIGGSYEVIDGNVVVTTPGCK